MTQMTQMTRSTTNPMTTEETARKTMARPYARRLTPDEDGGFTATIHEFPGCFAEGNTAAEAVEQIEAAAVAWVAAALESGHAVPEPLATSEHSGKVALRMSRALHKMAAERAIDEGVSVNQLLITAVATFLGQQEGLNRAISVFRQEVSARFDEIRWATNLSSSWSNVASLSGSEPVSFSGAEPVYLTQVSQKLYTTRELSGA